MRECEEGFSSATCETCQANSFSESCGASCSVLGCSSAGRCTPSGDCECYEGFTGADCSRRVCDDGRSGTDCGACQADGTCECYEGYSGASCEVTLGCQDAAFSGVGCGACAEGRFGASCDETCSLLGPGTLVFRVLLLR